MIYMTVFDIHAFFGFNIDFIIKMVYNIFWCDHIHRSVIKLLKGIIIYENN